MTSARVDGLQSRLRFWGSSRQAARTSRPAQDDGWIEFGVVECVVLHAPRHPDRVGARRLRRRVGERRDLPLTTARVGGLDFRLRFGRSSRQAARTSRPAQDDGLYGQIAVEYDVLHAPRHLDRVGARSLRRRVGERRDLPLTTARVGGLDFRLRFGRSSRQAARTSRPAQDDGLYGQIAVEYDVLHAPRHLDRVGARSLRRRVGERRDLPSTTDWVVASISVFGSGDLSASPRPSATVEMTSGRRLRLLNGRSGEWNRVPSTVAKH